MSLNLNESHQHLNMIPKAGISLEFLGHDIGHYMYYAIIINHSHGDKLHFNA